MCNLCSRVNLNFHFIFSAQTNFNTTEEVEDDESEWTASTFSFPVPSWAIKATLFVVPSQLGGRGAGVGTRPRRTGRYDETPHCSACTATYHHRMSGWKWVLEFSIFFETERNLLLWLRKEEEVCGSPGTFQWKLFRVMMMNLLHSGDKDVGW